jgi:hypothetical protein
LSMGSNFTGFAGLTGAGFCRAPNRAGFTGTVLCIYS